MTITRYLLNRVVFGLIVLIALSLFVFLLFYLAPGDPARTIAGDKANNELLDQVRQNLGLNRPIWEQYLTFASNFLQGNIGFSYRSQLPVASIIFDRLPVTLSLVLGGLLIWLVIGIPIGVASARRPGSVRDRIGQVFALLGVSFPTFVLGMMSLYLLYFLPTRAGFPIFPPSGYVAFKDDILGWAWHLILPWVTLALVTAAIYARLTRGQMLDVLSEDYIRTAHAKGLTERRVIYKHAFRSAMPPLVTQLGNDVGFLLGGAIVIEQVYGLPGIGNLAVTAVQAQDRPVIVGVVLLGGFFIVVVNLVVDVCYVLLDSRVRTAT